MKVTNDRTSLIMKMKKEEGKINHVRQDSFNKMKIKP